MYAQDSPTLICPTTLQNDQHDRPIAGMINLNLKSIDLNSPFNYRVSLSVIVLLCIQLTHYMPHTCKHTQHNLSIYIYLYLSIYLHIKLINVATMPHLMCRPQCSPTKSATHSDGATATSRGCETRTGNILIHSNRPMIKLCKNT